MSEFTVRSEKPAAHIVEISPARARALLEHCNKRNRAVDERRVAMYTQEIKAGRWLFTGEAIKISREGLLLDGQHRLWAVLEANVALPLLVITGLDPKAQEVMDQGMPRALHDALHLRGEPNPNYLAGALRAVAHYYRDGVPFQAGSNPGMSHGFALKLFDSGDNRERLHEALRFVTRQQQKWNSLSVMTGLHYLFEHADHERAIAFTHALLTGDGGTAAARALHSQLVAEFEGASIDHPRAHVKVRTVYIVQAWNLGESSPPLRYGWTHRDGFPGIAGLDSPITPAEPAIRGWAAELLEEEAA